MRLSKSFLGFFINDDESKEGNPRSDAIMATGLRPSNMNRTSIAFLIMLSSRTSLRLFRPQEQAALTSPKLTTKGGCAFSETTRDRESTALPRHSSSRAPRGLRFVSHCSLVLVAARAEVSS
ncbi:hypothetical protein B296_00048339 [Ensete ventricosum]|uniref:Uncharacterized protein n=1 Tax=Ensete ventricosum TaxID=4639 RepID=A0A426XVR1_ENSVE|nr:hypothetical protein B296_00048339 [Ensete ventricosum]